MKVINDSRKYESTREVDGRLVLEALNPKAVFGDGEREKQKSVMRKGAGQNTSKSPNLSYISSSKKREIIKAIKEKNSALRLKKQDLLKPAISLMDEEINQSPQS